MRSQIALVFLVAAGCGGGSDQPDMGRVTGTVTLDGNPLPDAHVSFAPGPLSQGGTSTAKTDASGKYELVYKRDIMGAVVGTHSVRVWTVEDEGDTIDEATGKPIPRKKEVVPARYNTESTLEKVVAEGEQVIDLELTTK